MPDFAGHLFSRIQSGLPVYKGDCPMKKQELLDLLKPNPTESNVMDIFDGINDYELYPFGFDINYTGYCLFHALEDGILMIPYREVSGAEGYGRLDLDKVIEDPSCIKTLLNVLSVVFHDMAKNIDSHLEMIIGAGL
jgi:hypothetical protein